ncbi:Myosin-M heavy chain [Chionoecetes opilio]|uniref:Myosin-M heavy chain n=1 Tax=Chionoecetes opilio TaxID=41210 RepID=A0A8J4XV63_CHIOP|nr:Myosin-M heavy chain [Chionoecetes opilio]
MDYGGSVTPAKARRSWGDLLKFRSRPKERQLSPGGGGLHQPPLPAPVTHNHNYMAEYRQKYGGYSGTVGRSSYQALRVVRGMSPPLALTSPSPLNSHSHATKTTMSSTVRYTDWFGSVAGRRPPIRPPLPAFPGAPPPSLHAPEKSAAWDHYVTLDPVYEAPRVVPMQLYTNVCVCPEQLLNTRSKKKKKCKKCGRKVATVRHATASMAAKVRPTIPANLYQPPAPTPVAASRAWGWQVLEEQIYERYEVQARQSLLPATPSHGEEESPTTTPETIRSVKSTRSTRSGRSNDSSTTITRDALEPSRPAPAPPPPRVPSSVQDDQNIATSSFSAKETLSSGEIGDKRSSILTENPSAYQLLSSFGPPHQTSDTDELSDNAVDTSWDTEVATPTKDSRTGTVITVGSSPPRGKTPAWQAAHKEAVNKIKIYSNPNDTIYNSGVNDSLKKIEDIRCGSSNDITMSPAYNNNNEFSNEIINSSVPLCNGGDSSSFTSKVGYRINNNCTKKAQNNATKSANHERKNGLKNNYNSVVINGNKRNLLRDGKHTSMGSHSSQVGGRSTTIGPKLEVKKLREASELQQGGNTVRIAGQRMLVLTPGAAPPEPRSGFSSGEDDTDISVDDDTSDYPQSSPSRGSDTDTLPEEEDLPLDSSDSSFSYSNPNLDSAVSSLGSSAFPYEESREVNDRWTAARDIIYEEEETGETDKLTNGNKDETEENYGNSSSLGDEEPSVSSSSAGSPLRPEGLHPTLSELLKVKSILKKPPSVDTSSETDSDFYLPMLEHKQNQRKKKQVQFRASHDVTVIEDAGESKGRKVSSTRHSRREQDKENRKNNYNLFSELQDIYGRSNVTKVHKPQIMDSFANSKDEESELNGHSEYENNQGSELNASESNEQHDVEVEARENGEPEPRVPPLDSVNSAHLENDEKEAWRADQDLEDCRAGGDSNQWSRLHRRLSECQTSGESFPDLQDAANHNLSQHHNHPVTTVAIPSPHSIPTRQAPPPPRSRTMSPTRPSVPPPPPPTVRPTAACASPSRSSPRERPLPSPPPLPSRPPPESPPPSPPPPLPTSAPPLEETERITIMNFSTQDSSPSQNPTFHSFKAPDASLYQPTQLISSPHAGSSIEVAHSKDEIREVLPPAGHFPIFGEGEEARTATIRSRGAGHTRPSFLDAFVAKVSPNATTLSSPPQAPQRRNRNSSQSPEASAGATRQFRYRVEGHGSQASLQKGAREEDPYDQFTDHIYEELLSRSPPISSPFSSHCSPTQESTQLKPLIPGKSIFEGASKDEILEYLQDARCRVANSVDEEDDRDQDLVGDPLEAEVDLEDDEEEDQLGVDPPEDQFTVLTSRNRGNRSSNMSSNSDSSENSGLLSSDKERLVCGEVERTDSGVGSETSKPSLLLRHGKQIIVATDRATAVREGGELPLCDDCDSAVDTRVTNSGVVYAPLVCRRCSRRRGERKEILTEIMETEIKYGQDLRVMIDQFYRPILVAGLLSREQLKSIFLNVEDLLEHNRIFSLQLRDALEIALDQGDEDLLTVNVARLFLQAAPMLHAFETYCVRQGSASLLLQTLEKEKELLRIFLKVSQMENTLLRRMNLHSFLMVPVQRVTKYPLLLARLYKATPTTHASREDCRRAKEKIELHLQYMNNETKDVSPTKLWRRISMSVGSGTPMKRSSQSQNFSRNLKLRKLALQVLDWNTEEATVVREGRLFCLAPDSNNWTRRGRSLKMMTVHVLLVTLGMPRALFEEEVAEDGLVMSRNLGIKDAAILAFKDLKVSKAALIRQEPWHLSRCVVAWEGEGEAECFEVSDLNSKDTFIFKGSDAASTESWFRYIQFHALSVGTWKRRRPALANIMINGMGRC